MTLATAMVDNLADAALMFTLAIISVGLWTLRVVLTADGRRLVGAATAATEASVFAVVFANLISDLTQPTRIVGYAVGVAAGTLLGLHIEDRLSHVSYHAVIEGVLPRIVNGRIELVDGLLARGWSRASITATRRYDGNKAIVMVTVDRRCWPKLRADIAHLAPEATWSVSQMRDAAAPAACAT